MDDNAGACLAAAFENYLKGHGLKRMEWPAPSPELNPIEHVWENLGRHIGALGSSSRFLDPLQQGLLDVSSSFPISTFDNLIYSMESRCRQRIIAMGSYIPS